VIGEVPVTVSKEIASKQQITMKGEKVKTGAENPGGRGRKLRLHLGDF